jgi:hypothetical protein
MLRLVLLLVAVAGVAAFFTRPDEGKMRETADAMLSDPQNLGQAIEGGVAALAGNRDYTNYYLASRYLVTIDNDPVVTCWGAFTKVQCSRAADEPAEST